MADILRQRVHRRDVLSGAGAIAALSLSTLPMPAVAQQRALKLGYISPKSGPLALFGQADEFVLRSVTEAIGGSMTIRGKSYPIKIISKDTQSSANRAAEVTSELILKDKVDLVLVSSAPETVNPVSDQCELNEIGRASCRERV